MYHALLDGKSAPITTVTGEAGDALQAEGIFRLAGTEYRAGKYTSARDMYAKVLLDHPRSALVRDAAFFLGECELALGNLAGAEKRYRTVIDVYPDSPYRDTANLRLAEITARAGRAGEALEQVDAALKRSGTGASRDAPGAMPFACAATSCTIRSATTRRSPPTPVPANC